MDQTSWRIGLGATRVARKATSGSAHPADEGVATRPALACRAVPIVLALFSAAAYGVADFLGGTASRRMHALMVTVISMSAGAVCLALVCAIQGGVLTGADVAWSFGAGIVGSIGIVTFYSALALGPMGVVAPVSAVTSAIVPVATGFLLGERPSGLAVVGIAAALPAIVMVARERRLPGEPPSVALSTIVHALATGAGFGGYLVLISRTSEASNLLPVLVGRGASIVVMAVLAWALGVLAWPKSSQTETTVRQPRPRGPEAGAPDGGTEDAESGPDRSLQLALSTGVFDAGGNVFYLLAVRGDLLALVAAVQSLYPAATVGLAGAFHGERPQRVQIAGMGLAVVAVLLVALG